MPRKKSSLAARLPAALLRRSDRALWRPVKRQLATVVCERSGTICAGYPTDLSDPLVKQRMEECNSWTQEEYIKTVRSDLWIDPGTGFVLLPGFRFLEASLPYAYQAAKPSALGFLAARSGTRPALEFDRVISFRDVNEHNYFHFFNDVLTKIPMLEQAGMLDAPVLIGTRLYRQPFFQAVLPALSRSGLKVVDQGDQFVRTKEVVYCKSMPYSRTYFNRVLDLLEVPFADEGTRANKLFLMRSRSNTAQRLIGNLPEVTRMLEAHGFSVCDTGQLGLHEQMALLGNTRYLITVHGAGATNMIFRRGAAMDILELFPAEIIPPHYYALANGMGHGYNGLVCGTSGANGQFHVPLDQLSTALARLLAKA